MCSTSNAATALPAELADRLAWPVPYPDVVLEGCRPLVPYHAAAAGKFHAGEIRPEDVGERPHPPGACPVCRGACRTTFPDQPGIDGRIVRYCAACSTMGEPWERNAAHQRTLHEARERSKAAKHAVQRQAITAVADGVKLSEVERRRLWNGYLPGSMLAEVAIDDLLGRSRLLTARLWLRDIGQEPDFDLVLDTRGKAVGRLSEGYEYPHRRGPEWGGGEEEPRPWQETTNHDWWGERRPEPEPDED